MRNGSIDIKIMGIGRVYFNKIYLIKHLGRFFAYIE